MAKEVEDQFDQVVPDAAGRSEQFLGVLKERCQQEAIGITLVAAKRRGRDGGLFLRAPLKVGRGTEMELEVFADPRGSSLHVGWQATSANIGNLAGNLGIMREVQMARNFSRGKASTARAMSGLLQTFQVAVFLPVLEQLVDAVEISRGGRAENGFLS